jgi:adenine-specific DNA-methyltransferase
MEKLVQRRIDLEKSCRAATSDPERGKLQEKIRSTGRQIDALVYGLYGLTADEMAVVEDAVGR